MFAVQSLPVAIAFCVVTMLGWGSWANTQKLAGKEKWPFELFYWDYAIGVFLFGLIFAHTLGSYGSAGMSARENMHAAGWDVMAPALESGALFNLSNILLVVGIDAAGMCVAFPVGVGLALVIGTVESYLEAPKGNPALIFGGVALIVCAMIFSAVAHSRLPHSGGRSKARGLVYSVIAGCLMGFFYPLLMKSISPNFNTAPIAPGMLTPYVALVAFGAGVLGSNIVWNIVLIRGGGMAVLVVFAALVLTNLVIWVLMPAGTILVVINGSNWTLMSGGTILNGAFLVAVAIWVWQGGWAPYAAYFRGSMKLHVIGILGGFIWMIALSFNVIASSVAGPAISYALGQGATLVAALWGLLIWHEFRHATAGTGTYIGLMLLGYAGGLILIGAASV